MSEAVAGAEHPWRELWNRIGREEKRLVILAFVSGVSWSVCAVGVPYVAGLGVDELRTGADPWGLTWVAVLVVVLALGKALALRYRRWLMPVSSARAAGQIRKSLYRSLHSDQAESPADVSAGEILGVLGDDTEYIEQFGVNAQVLANNLAWTAMIAAVMVWIDPLLALVVLAPLPLVLVASMRFLRALEPANRELRSKTVAATAMVADAMQGASIIQGLGLRGVFERRFSAASDEIRLAGVEIGRIRAFWTAIAEFVPTLSIALAILAGAAQVQAGQLSWGGLVAFNGYIVMAVWPLRFTANAIAGASRAKLAIHRILLLESGAQSTSVSQSGGPSRTDLASSHDKADARAEVKLNSVSFTYPLGENVLRDVSFEVAPGELVVVTGDTGAGKSTLLRLVGGDLSPQVGSVQVGGYDIDQLTAGGRGQLVSLVSQSEFLFSRSLAENLRMAYPDAEEAQLGYAASLAVLDDVVEQLPDGWDTQVGERGARLSGGQRQRAALARGILSPASVLLLDDVTSALDTETSAALAGLLPQLKTAGRTVIVVTAEPHLMAIADRVLTLSGGKVTQWAHR
ncbi:MAG: ABC transporter ATP-binding protein/permease [Propionibacteriaceae bacterium]|jgi:ATP-binding cassette subfamily B protein|nr:ABC transporter ATP-binding protein/permease [Propionibacteriaceae bacterium]